MSEHHIFPLHNKFVCANEREVSSAAAAYLYTTTTTIMQEDSLLDRLPCAVVRHDLGPLLCSKDLAQLCAADPRRGAARVRLLGGGRLHHHYFADGPLDDAALRAFARARVFVIPFTGTRHVPLTAKQMAIMRKDAKRALRKEGGGPPGRPRTLMKRPSNSDATTLVATCHFLNGRLHSHGPKEAGGRPARFIILGHGRRNGVVITVTREEYWCHGQFMYAAIGFAR